MVAWNLKKEVVVSHLWVMPHSALIVREERPCIRLYYTYAWAVIGAGCVRNVATHLLWNGGKVQCIGPGRLRCLMPSNSISPITLA